MIRIVEDISDPLWRIQNLYLIKDKDRNRVRPKFKPSQLRIVEAIGDRLRRGEPIRHFDGKCRQSMVTTFWMLLYLDDAIFHPNTRAAIIAQKRDTLKLIWDAARFAHASMPSAIQPALGEDSANVLAFMDSGSRMMVALKVQGGTVNSLHVSEYPLCDPDEIEQTIAACPPSANITLEGVFEGMNHAYDKWTSDGDGFTRLFHPWFVQPEYRLEPRGKIVRTPEEIRVAKIAAQDYGIALEDSQVQYRRDAKTNLKRLFAQEMAEDPISCFLSTGNTYFDNRKIKVLLEEAKRYSKENGVDQESEEIVFEKPTPRCIYCAGADVAEGIDGGSGSGRDYSTLAILCVTHRRTAYRFKDRIGLDEFYRLCDKKGREYNRALLGVERNNHGHAILLGLTDTCKYPNLYREKPREPIDRTNYRNTIAPLRFGWETNSVTKPIMMDRLKLALEGNSEDDEDSFAPLLHFLDVEFLKETLNIVEEKRKIGARVGKHDDLVMAYAIALQMYMIVAGRGLDIGSIKMGEDRESARDDRRQA